MHDINNCRCMKQASVSCLKLINSKLTLILVAIASLLFITTMNISAEEYVPAKTIRFGEKQKVKGQWRATAYHLHEVGDYFFETSELPAKICFSEIQNPKTAACHEAKGVNDFPFQEVTDLKLVLLDKSRTKYGVLFTAQHHGATIGKTKYISIWVFKEESKGFANLLEKTAITDQGEFKIYSSLIGKSGYFILADRIWDSKTETLYAPHYYEISIFKLHESKYEFVSKYKTSKKYNSLDNTTRINVIDPEKQNIIKVLKQIGD